MSRTITKNEMAGIIADKNKLLKTEVLQVIEDFFEIVEEEVKKGNEVNIVKFGVFKLKINPAKERVLPRTGKKFMGDEVKTLMFKSRINYTRKEKNARL